MPRTPAVAAALAMLAGACTAPAPAAPTAPLQPSTAEDTPVSTAAVLPSAPPTPSPAPLSDAASFPDPESYGWALVASGFESPVDIQFPADGSGRMFVVEQPGRIRAIALDAEGAPPFLDISARVNSRGNEQGLLGLAFHPRYSENGLFFVNYTDHSQHNVISRFQASGDPSAAVPGTETILISVDDPFPNHNGGVLAFGPEGYLYAGMGDGGSANDPFGNGQDRNTLLGKILRIDVDQRQAYGIPGDNPFWHGGGRPEIWALGLRNPWRMSFDSLTRDLWIGDVGQGTWEEIDFTPAGAQGGANFGWNIREGTHAFGGAAPSDGLLIDPVAEYSHSEGGCSVTGGYVYRGAMPEWSGIYLYADYCSGKMWGLLRAAGVPESTTWTSQLLFETGANITTFGQDQAGEVYFADRSGGIFRLEHRQR